MRVAIGKEFDKDESHSSHFDMDGWLRKVHVGQASRLSFSEVGTVVAGDEGGGSGGGGRGGIGGADGVDLRLDKGVGVDGRDGFLEVGVATVAVSRGTPHREHFAEGTFCIPQTLHTHVLFPSAAVLASEGVESC